MSIGQVDEHDQDEALVTYAGKVERQQAVVDWSRSGEVVSRAIRAYDPKPGAFTLQRGVEVKLFGARRTEEWVGDAGTVVDIDESGMMVACTDGGVRIGYVQPAGKRRLAALGWAQGRGVAVGDVLGA